MLISVCSIVLDASVIWSSSDERSSLLPEVSAGALSSSESSTLLENLQSRLRRRQMIHHLFELRHLEKFICLDGRGIIQFLLPRHNDARRSKILESKTSRLPRIVTARRRVLMKDVFEYAADSGILRKETIPQGKSSTSSVHSLAYTARRVQCNALSQLTSTEPKAGGEFT